jgi:hypothetical protein
MLKYLTYIPEKLHQYIDKANSKSNTIILIGAIIIMQFMFLSLYDEITVHGQEDGHAEIDSIRVYDEEAKKTSAANQGAEGASNPQLQATEDVASTVQGITTIYGVKAAKDGEEYAAKYGLSDTTKAGILGVVETHTVALAVDPIGVNIPAHLANQWLPGHDQHSGFSVYAQGDSYKFFKNDIGLEPIWEMFRDIAYAGFVMVLVVAGFMIIFRSKIGGQVTVGIMNTIPGVILGLILVTFSFSIVGFIVDLARLFSFLLVKLMETSLQSSAGGNFSVVTLPNSPFVLAFHAFTAVPVGRATPYIGALAPILMFFGPLSIISLIGALVILVVGLAALFASIKIYTMLVTTYVKLVIDLIFGPMFILMGSLPGKQSAIWGWLKRVGANALVFPVTVFAINLIRYIGYSSVNASTPMRFMSGGNTGATSILPLRGIVVIAGLFLVSGIPDMIQEALQTGTPKSVAGAAEKAKKAAGKIPLVGGFLG